MRDVNHALRDHSYTFSNYYDYESRPSQERVNANNVAAQFPVSG